MAFPEKARVIERIEDLRVGKEAAVPLGLVVNEVITNALNHAFPGGRRGTISITLKPLDGTRAKLSIADDVIGFDASQRAKGMGRRLLAGLVRQLGGEFEFKSDGGSKFEMTFPLERLPR